MPVGAAERMRGCRCLGTLPGAHNFWAVVTPSPHLAVMMHRCMMTEAAWQLPGCGGHSASTATLMWQCWQVDGLAG